MNHVDVLIICAEALPVRQAMDLLSWWVGYPSPDVDDMRHPSFDWWIRKHANEVVALMAKEGRVEVLE
jgi:hypothetical protein